MKYAGALGLAVAVVLGSLSGSGQASDRYVWLSGGNNSPYQTWADAATNLQTAVDAAQPGEQVWVTNGTYNITNQVSITNGIAVRSVNGPDVTTVQGPDTAGVRIFSLAHASAVLDGFTIRKGRGVSGSGVYMTAGTVTICVIRNNNLAGTTYYAMNGAGVYMTGGLLVRSTVVSNELYSNLAGVGVWASGAGAVISHCTIAYNSNARDGLAGGIYLEAGATLRNSLVRGNAVANNIQGGGVYLTGASSLVESCTIVENTAGDGGGIYIAGGAVSNSIVYFNSAGANPNYHAGGAGFVYSCTTPLPAGGSGNTAFDPLFVNRAGGDFRVLAGPARNTGNVMPWMSTAMDLNGNPRLDSNGRVDMGAYQRQRGALECSLAADPPLVGIAPLTVAFHSYVNALNTNGLSYGWDFENDGSTDAEGPGQAAPSHPYTGPGRFAVRLAVSNAGSETATFTYSNLVTVTLSNLYVSTTGSSQVPYTNLATAATNFLDAFTVAGSGAQILIDSGVYPLTQSIELDRSIRLYGINGAATTILQRTGAANFRIVHMTDANAVVEGLTLRNGIGQEGAGVYMTTGTVRNCIIRDNSASGFGYNGGGVYMIGGLVTGCSISNNYSYIGAGSGVYMTGGLLYRCLVASNELFSNQGGGGVWASGANTLVSHCIIERNKQTRDGPCAGVYLSGGATLRNSLVRSNALTGTGTAGGGVYVTGAGSLVESCTIVSNIVVPATGDGGGVYLAGGAVSNSIVYFNGAASNPNYHPGGNGFAYSCTTPTNGLTGPGNIDGDPLFVNPSATNFHLPAGSPCVNSGWNANWMLTGTDLDGRPRLFKGRVDMGVYELPPNVPGVMCQFR